MRQDPLRCVAVCIARHALPRLPEAPRLRLCSTAALQSSTRRYTAIPLTKHFLRHRTRPHSAGTKETHLPVALPEQRCAPSSSLACRTAQNAQALANAASAAVEPLRVSESLRPASRVACVRVPRLLVFGGDVVSVTALEALHARMRCIVTEALRCARGGHAGAKRSAAGASSAAATPSDLSEEEEEKAEVDAFVREHITVVCPALPKGVTPEEAAKKFTRQYPVARYCVDNGLPIIPVDHPKSLTRSTLLTEMLRTVQKNATATSSAAPFTPAAATSSRVSRPQRNAPLTSHISSHVLRASQLTQRGGAADSAHPTATFTNAAAEEKKTAKRDGLAGEGTAHTWAVHGRPLDDYDLTVVVSFRYFLPQHLLRVLPPVINMHPSLLPRYRGASPIFSALRHNEAVGGVSIIQMKPEQKAMDSGSILWQCEVPMTPDMDIRLYFPLVTQIGAAGLCDLIFGEAPAAHPFPFSSSSSAALTRAAAAAVVESASTSGAIAAPPSHTLLHGTTSLLSSAAAPRSMPSRGHTNECDDEEAARAAAWEQRGEAREISEKSSSEDKAVSSSSSSSIPPWVALRRSSLMPVVHRSGSSARLPSSLHGRERLSPYVDRPELSLFSSIITAHHAEVESALDGEASSSVEDEWATSAADAPQQCRHWMTLCRRSTHITPEVVRAASTAHRALFFQNLEGASTASSAGFGGRAKKHGNTPVNKKHVSPAAAAAMDISTAMKCAEVFPKSVLSSHCDWPDSFTYSWKFAQQQEYHTFKHFTEDPYHAPLLPKDAAVLHFSTFSAMEAFGTWRAFVGGDYFQPSVNATLDKSGSPVRNQLVHRGVRRLLRERAKASKRTKSATHSPSCTRQKQQHSEAAAPPVMVVAASEGSETPVGIVVGTHVDLDVFNPAGLQLLTEAENTLRTPCTFTQVTNPALVPPCVQAELAEVERGGDRGSAGRRVRFYRAPPAIFRSLLSSRATKEAGLGESAQRRGRRGTSARESGQLCAEKSGPLRPASSATDGLAPQECVREKLAVKQQPEEPTEDEEAPEDYVPDVIHAAPPTEQQRWHIPPGTGYFPESDENYGAIKCREGWLVWKEAHMKWANKAQPAVLIRKGLAMKTGVLYSGLFSEYS